MKKRLCYTESITWFGVILVSLSLYAFAYVGLNKGLYSIYDEGFFFLRFKPSQLFTVTTRPLAMGGELIQAVFPKIGDLDVLGLRRLSFGVFLLGLLMLVVCSCYFFFAKKREQEFSYYPLVAYVLLIGLLCVPDIAINGNYVLLFFEMVALSFCFLGVSVKRKWSKALCVSLVGFLSWFAIICNAPGGGMLLVLCALFLVFYDGLERRSFLSITVCLFLGMLLAVTVMHFTIVSIQDFRGFIVAALSQTTSGGTASHHSLWKVGLVVLFGIRDLLITVTALCGVTYLLMKLSQRFNYKWLLLLTGAGLFMILYKWQIKPAITFVGIVAWLSIMAWDGKIIGELDLRKKEIVLFLFLLFLPICLAFGTNTDILDKTMTFVAPWGVLLYCMHELYRERSIAYSRYLCFFVAAFVFVSVGRILLVDFKSDSYHFNKEKPIARMGLTEPQFSFYSEVYDELFDYGYASQHDTILGFCFNEMTIVAMDAIPYTNDQQPEEFLLHDKEKLVKPTFMILSEWDEIVLSSFFESLNWDVQNTYDIIRLKNNPDPDSGWEMTQSSLYCLKTRRLFPNNEIGME